MALPPVPQNGRWVYVQHLKFPLYHDPPFLTRTQKWNMLRKKAESQRVVGQKIVNQAQARPVIRRFEGESNKWVRKVDLTDVN